MANLFFGSEIVEIGIEIEKNGRDFYNASVNRLKNPKAKEIFGYLAGEEEKHIVVFEDLLKKVQRYEPSESYPGEYLSYMKTLAGEYVFTKKDKGNQIAQKAKSDLEAINIGIGFEKDSIVFYEGMKKAVPQSDHKIIDELIKQEQNHLVQLSDLKKRL